MLDRFSSIRITPNNVCVKNILDLVGTNVVTVEWDEENITKEGNKALFSGVTVITLKFGKAVHARDYIFNTDEETRKAWGE